MLMWAGAAFGWLYLALIVALGIKIENYAACKIAIFSAGMAYSCTAANAWEPRGSVWRIASSLYIVALVAGAAAGMTLL